MEDAIGIGASINGGFSQTVRDVLFGSYCRLQPTHFNLLGSFESFTERSDTKRAEVASDQYRPKSRLTFLAKA
jgi:hypothetical protein